MNIKKTPLEIATHFVAHCKKNDIQITRCDRILTLEKRLTGSDRNRDFSDAESDCSIIYDLPSSADGGSVWGTDGGSIGGMVAMQTGLFKLNRSGVSKRVLLAIKKIK